MAIELKMLAWTLVLAFAQIMLFGLTRTAEYGPAWNTGPRDEAMPPLSPRTGRLQRAQDNLYETLPLFIAAVLIAHVAGREDNITHWGAQIYFWGRVAYVPIYAFGLRHVRTLVWVAATVGLVMVASQILV